MDPDLMKKSFCINVCIYMHYYFFFSKKDPSSHHHHPKIEERPSSPPSPPPHTKLSNIYQVFLVKGFLY